MNTKSFHHLRRVLPLVFVFALLTGTAMAEAQRHSGLIAEGTEWENPYYVIDSGVDGPTLLITGGLHGNEPAGAWAADQIRHWPIQRGRLIVVPRANTPGLRQETRWLPGEAEETRNANRNFPKSGEPNTARSVLVKALWDFIQAQQPDWVVDLHEGYDFHVANPKSDGSSIIYFDTPEMQAITAKIEAEVNATIDDADRKIVRLSKSGPINGGLVRAAVERLGVNGLCLETTYRDQRLPVRTRQHRVMVGCLMRQLGMVGDDAVNTMTGNDPSSVKIALYDAQGTSSRAMENMDCEFVSQPLFVLQHVGPTDIHAGVLDQFDVVMFAGGSGSKQAATIGPQGRQAVQRFVESGGGYVGVCAGAYLASAKYTWSLALLNANTFTGNREIPGEGVKSMWYRGKGEVRIEWTEEGQRILGPLPDRVDVHYGSGPIFSPARKESLPKYTPLAVYRSEIYKWEPQRGTMVDTPAIIASRFGQGRAIAISPHPEATAGLESVVRRAVIWAAGRSASRRSYEQERCQEPFLPRKGKKDQFSENGS